MATNLERLNKLLKENHAKLKIPSHITEVYATGKNQLWLRKNLAKNPNTPTDLMTLLNMTAHQLVQNAV